MQTYIRLDDAQYPFTADQIKAANPNTSFPQYLQPEDAESVGFAPVQHVSPGHDPATQEATEIAPVNDAGVWKQAWTIRNLTQAELDQREADRLAAEEAARIAAIPISVSPRQIRQALTRVNLRATVEAAIAAADQDTKDWYEFATAFERTNPKVAELAAALSVTDRQLDDLWTLAGTL